MGSEQFRKHEHLRKSADFERVFQAKCSASNDVLVVYAAANGLDCARLGISVSKRVGPAVDRTYTRRRIREAFRRNKRALPAGFDIVCVARPRAKKREADLVGSLVELTALAAKRWNERARRLSKARQSSDRRGQSTDRSP